MSPDVSGGARQDGIAPGAASGSPRRTGFVMPVRSVQMKAAKIALAVSASQ